MSIILKDYTKYFNKYYHKVLYIHSLQMIKTSFSKLRVPRGLYNCNSGICEGFYVVIY